jgi:hypothetical protein
VRMWRHQSYSCTKFKHLTSTNSINMSNYKFTEKAQVISLHERLRILFRLGYNLPQISVQFKIFYIVMWDLRLHGNTFVTIEALWILALCNLVRRLIIHKISLLPWWWSWQVSPKLWRLCIKLHVRPKWAKKCRKIKTLCFNGWNRAE